MPDDAGLLSALSVGDQTGYPATLDFTRRLVTQLIDDEYHVFQRGRTIYRDDFESTLQWNDTGTGAVAVDATRYLHGTQSVKLTTDGNAGHQTILNKNFTLVADQGHNPHPLVVASLWWCPVDTHSQDIQLFVRPDDSAARWEAAVRFHIQQAGVAANTFQYLDHTGTFQTVDTYAIPVPAGNVSDPWHRLILGFNYLQGAGGYANYAFAVCDDFVWLPTTLIGAHSVATNSVRATNVNVLVTEDAAVAAVVNIDQFLLADLSGALNLGAVISG